MALSYDRLWESLWSFVCWGGLVRGLVGGRAGVACVVGAVAYVMAGCSAGTPGSPVSPGSPGSVVSSSPSSGGSADALYAEAEQVYLRSLEVRDRFETYGDYSEFPPELADLLGDPYLRWARVFFDESKVHGWHSPEGARVRVTTKPLPGMSRDGSEVALQTCRDGRGIPALDSAGTQVGSGALAYETLFFKRVDGRLKLFTGTTDQRDSCPFE